MNLFQCKTIPQVIRALEKLLTHLSDSESKAVRAKNELQKGLFLLNEEFDDVFSMMPAYLRITIQSCSFMMKRFVINSFYPCR